MLNKRMKNIGMKVYKKKSPKGDENDLSVIRPISSSLYIKRNPLRGTRTVRLPPLLTLSIVYKKKSPKGDENM